MSYRKVRLSDVARVTKVSHATVSAILNAKTGGNIRYSKETAALVMQTAQEMGYVPNQAARNLRRGDSGLIAVFTYEDIFPVESQTEFYDFFVGIQKEAEAIGFDLLILNTRKNLSSSRLTIASGAVMIGVSRNDQDIKALVKRGYPLVFVGRRKIGEIQTHWVTFDYTSVIKKVFTRIPSDCTGVVLYKQSFIESEPSEDKEFAVRQFCAEYSLQLQIVPLGTSMEDDGLRFIQNGWFVLVDRLSLLPVINHTISSLHLELGKDIHGFVMEDDWLGSGTNWTHWSNERKRLGALAVVHLRTMMKSESCDTLPSLVPLDIVDGISC